MRRQRLLFGIALVAIALLGALAGSYLARPGHASNGSAVTVGEYYCPMHPEVRSGQPGRCPICGMDLVADKPGAPGAPGAPAQPVEGHGHHHGHADEAHGEARAGEAVLVHVPPATQERIGIVLETVRVEPLASRLSVPAQVVADERKAITVSPKVEGWIRRLRVASNGEPVRAGQMLYEIYSPELLQRQREYLDVLTRRDALAERGGTMAAIGNTRPDSMITSVARERHRLRQVLLSSDVPERVIVDIERSRRVQEVVPVLAQHDGVVTAINAREGAYVMPAQPVLAYADLRAAAVELSITAQQLGALSRQEQVFVRSSVEPGVTMRASVERERALIDPQTQQVRLRAALPASAATQRAFPPGSLVQVEVQGARKDRLTVARDALLHGEGGTLVMVADGNDHFRAANVTIGIDSAERVEVVSGLEAGQQVVVNGQFLLGAEASLQASRQRLAARSAATQHSHQEHAHHGQ